MTRHPGPPDFSETAHGMVAQIIRKADPDAPEVAIVAEPSEALVATVVDLPNAHAENDHVAGQGGSRS